MSLAGLGVLVAAISASQGLYLESVSGVQIWWMTMIAAGICAVAASFGTSWQWTGLISASFLVGTSSQLAMWKPVLNLQPRLWQHIQPFSMSKYSLALLAVVAIQGELSAYVLLRRERLSNICQFVASLGVARVGAFVLLMLVSSVSAIQYIWVTNLYSYALQIFYAGGLLALNIATCLALAISLPEDKFANNFCDPANIVCK